MAPVDQEAEVVQSAEVPEGMPLPADPKAVFRGGLFVLALLATAYVASEIVLPLVFAIVLKLLLQPAMRMVERLRVPPDTWLKKPFGPGSIVGAVKLAMEEVSSSA
jgi:hypothetical protein